MPRIAPFEKYPDRYERWFRKNSYAYNSELRAVKSLLPEKSYGIEIGVGTGRFAKPLGIKLGVEPSKEMQKLSKKKKITLVDAIGEHLPLQNSIFDFVLMITTICFLDNIEQAFGEAFRILNSDGALIIGFIDRTSPIGTDYERYKESSAFYSIADFYSVEEVVNYLKQADFKQFSFRQTLFHSLSALNQIEPVKKGYGKGSFVVIKAGK